MRQYTTFLSPDGRQLVDSRGNSDDDRLRSMGWRSVDRQQVTTDAIKKSYNSWRDDAEAVGIGAMQGVPGLTGTVMKMLPEQTAQQFAAEISNEQTAHPYLTTGAQLATGAGIIAATGGLGELGLAASGATGTAAFLQTAAFNAAGSVAMGAGTRFDARSINHALSPQGEEKVAAETGHEWLLDAAIGAAIPAVSGVAFKAFKGLANVANEMKDSQIQRSILDHVKLSQAQYSGRQSELWQMVEGNNWHNMERDAVSLSVKNKLADATTEMNRIKGAATVPLSSNEAGQYANMMGTNLAAHPEVAQKVIQKAMQGLDVEALHGIRQDLRQAVDWKAFAENPVPQQGLVDAHDLTNGTINGLLQRNDPLLANDWVNVNKDYGNLAVLQDVFKTGKQPGPVSNSFWKDVAMVTGIGRIAGWGKAAMWASQGKNATKVFEKFSEGQFAETARAFSTMFDNAANKFAGALQKNFYGLSAAPGVYENIDSTRRINDNFDVISASVTAATKNQEMASARIMDAYTKSGMPDEIAARYTQQALAKNSFLASKLPQPPGEALGYVMPSTAQPIGQVQQNFMQYYAAVHDPVTVLENPTAQGLEVMSNFYPDTLAKAQAQVTDHLRSGAPSNLQQQIYAAKLLGTPVSALTNISTYRTMQAARQLVAQQEQQQAAQMQQQTRHSSSASSSGSSSQTRSQQLEQGR